MTTLEERVAALEEALFGKADKMDVDSLDDRVSGLSASVAGLAGQASYLAALIAAEADRRAADVAAATALRRE